MATQIQLRRDTAANWTSSNPVLAQAEPGYETDTGKIKYGDGSTAWNSLAYAESDQQFSSGSASSPSITFTGDTNTGIYSPGADQLALSTNGQGRLFVDANGNVKVGAPSTAAPFNVQGVGGIGIDIAGRSSDGGAQLRLMNNAGTVSNTAIFGGDTYGGMSSATYLAFQTAGSERLRITSAGLVGIGTSAPSERLSVNGGNVSVTTPNGTATQLILDQTGQNAFSLQIPASTQRFAIRDLVANSERFTIDSSGRVGIGTTSPSSLLHLSAGASDSITLERTGATPSICRIANAGNLLTFEQNTTGITFETGTTPQERARIDSSGRLLVGTSSTSGNATLHVNKGSAAGTDAGGLLLTNMAAMSSIGAGDDLGYINFGATTTGGVASYDAARILCEADATWGTNDYPSRLVFSTTADGASSPTERMRIHSNGRVGLGSSPSSASYLLDLRNSDIGLPCLGITQASSSFAQSSVFIDVNRATTDGSYNFLRCIQQGATDKLFIRDSGTVNNATGVYTTISSDERFKQDIVDLGSQWDDIKGVSLKKFRYKSDPTGDIQLGVIAQELQQVCPNLVTTRIATEEDVAASGGLVAEGDEVLGWKMSILPLKAVKALQEAMERIEQLETEMAAIKAQLA